MYILHAVQVTDQFSRELFVINYLFRTNWNAAARATVEHVALHFVFFHFPCCLHIYTAVILECTISNYCHH